jgi:uncharacterized SAM-binding protein YcdF (DUF218 family)
MFFVLSKILFYLLMPATWIAACLFYAVFSKKPQRKKTALILSLVLFLFFGNSLLVGKISYWWEPQPIKISELPDYELGIVLTGVVNLEMEPRDRVYFHKGADRALHAIQLYKLGKLKKILITGGTGKVTGEKISEARELRKVFLMCGVPDSVLILETESRNTRENAIFSKQVIDSLNLTGNKLLITSAFHMPRSKGCFDKVGIKADIFPTDFNGMSEIVWTPDIWLIPSEKAFMGWYTLIREWLGCAMYKLVGYI